MGRLCSRSGLRAVLLAVAVFVPGCGSGVGARVVPVGWWSRSLSAPRAVSRFRSFGAAAHRIHCPRDQQGLPTARILAQYRCDAHPPARTARPRPAGHRAGSPSEAGSWIASLQAPAQRSARAAGPSMDGSRTPQPSRSARPNRARLPTTARGQPDLAHRRQPAPIPSSPSNSMTGRPSWSVALQAAVPLRLVTGTVSVVVVVTTRPGRSVGRCRPVGSRAHTFGSSRVGPQSHQGCL